MEEQYGEDQGVSLDRRIFMAIEEAQRISSSRELSIVITKLEEAQLWLSKIVKKG